MAETKPLAAVGRSAYLKYGQGRTGRAAPCLGHHPAVR
jgi:hypothetical protein